MVNKLRKKLKKIKVKDIMAAKKRKVGRPKGSKNKNTIQPYKVNWGFLAFIMLTFVVWLLIYIILT